MAKKVQSQQIPTVFPLNPEQKAAAEAPFSPLLIVAGAGTGKTRTLTSRIAYLIEQGVPPEKICAITFTNKAAKEMAERTRLMIGAKRGPFIGTFHSLGARILREECRALDRKPNFTIFDDHDSFSLVKKAVKSVLPKKELGGGAGNGGEEKKKAKETPMMFSGEISKIKNIGYAEPASDLGKEKREAVQKIFQKYESALIENNAFDFDDLIGKAVAVMKADPAVLRKYQDRYDAILVDEYQDINPKQYELVQLLAGRHRNVSVVGDDEQTIYSWRYADIRLFLDFEKGWPGAKIFFLEENYRSTGNIINAAGAVVKNNLFRTPKTLWTKSAAGAPIKLFEAWGENEEAEWIAREIEKSREPAADMGTSAGTPQTAILYRTNAQSRAIEQALIRRNIPYQIFGGLKFYERREVKDAVAALRYVSNPYDTVSKERLEKNLSKKKFAEFKDAVAKAPVMAPHEIIALFLEKFNYFEYLEDGFINYDEREGNIAELIAFASGFESLSELLERLSLLQAIDDENNKDGEQKESSPAAVSLMTIHLAKGLEFDSVFIAGASEGLLPHGRSLADNRQLEEERRLMYVAMTRARKNLAISFYGTPSRFIEEIPTEYMKLCNGTEDAAETLGDDGDDNYEEEHIEYY
jgi:DNA helicase-2/ATP-dependent DNA helicase PcrA